VAQELRDPVEHGGDDEVSREEHVHPGLGHRPGRGSLGAGEEEKGNVVGDRIAPDDGAELHTVHVFRAVAAHDEIGPVALEGGEGEGGARGRG
jgi:hypothetical protein